MFRAEAVVGALAVADEFLEDFIQMSGGEDAKVTEYLYAFVGMNIDRAFGSHLDVRNRQIAAGAENHPEQVLATHVWHKVCRCDRCEAAGERGRF